MSSHQSFQQNFGSAYNNSSVSGGSAPNHPDVKEIEGKLEDITNSAAPTFEQGAAIKDVFGYDVQNLDAFRKINRAQTIRKKKYWPQQPQGWKKNWKRERTNCVNDIKINDVARNNITDPRFQQGASVKDVFGEDLNKDSICERTQVSDNEMDQQSQLMAGMAPCTSQKHWDSNGQHKKLTFITLDCREKLAIRRLLESKISESELKEKIVPVFPELKCYTVMEFILASYPLSQYRQEWIVFETDGSGMKYFSHKSVDDATRSAVVDIMGKWPSKGDMKKKFSRLPGLKYMTLADSLMAVYGEKFYTISAEIGNKKKYKDFKKRCSVICDRIRYEVLGTKSLAAKYMIRNDLGVLTYEQKLVAIGLLHNKLNMQVFTNNMIDLFPKISYKDGNNILMATFGRDYSPFVSSTAAYAGASSEEAVISLKESMIPSTGKDSNVPNVYTSFPNAYKNY